MNISSYSSMNLYSLKQALGMATLQKSMNRDASSVSNLLKTMEKTNQKTMEMSINPSVGGNIDIKL